MEHLKKWKIYLLCKEDKYLGYTLIIISYTLFKILIINKEFIQIK